MGQKFEEILEKILVDQNLDNELPYLQNFEKLYEDFKEEGYKHSRERFDEEMTTLLKHFAKSGILSDLDLEGVSGGKGVSTKFLAGLLGSIAATGAVPMTHTSALTASEVKQTAKTWVNKVTGFVKENPIVTGLGTLGAGTLVVGGGVLTGVAVHKYLNSIDRAIEKLSSTDANTLNAIIGRIVALVDKEADLEKVFNAEKNTNKNLQELERLGTKLSNKINSLKGLKDSNEKTIVSDGDTVKEVVEKIEDLAKSSPSSPSLSAKLIRQPKEEVVEVTNPEEKKEVTNPEEKKPSQPQLKTFKEISDDIKNVAVGGKWDYNAYSCFINILESIKKLAGDEKNLPETFAGSPAQSEVLALMNQCIDKIFIKEKRDGYKESIKETPKKCYECLCSIIIGTKKAAETERIKTRIPDLKQGNEQEAISIAKDILKLFGDSKPEKGTTWDKVGKPIKELALKFVNRLQLSTGDKESKINQLNTPSGCYNVLSNLIKRLGDDKIKVK